MTPEEFCWLYAIGCLESRHADGTLTENEYNEAVRLAQKNEFPTPVQVRLWFPKPFESAEEKTGNVRCTLTEMQNYWRVTHRNSSEQTPVLKCRVLSIPKGRSVLLRNLDYAGKNVDLLNAINIHNIPLSVMDDVFVHTGIIAEKCQK